MRGGKPLNVTDWCDKPGASALAERIAAYWAAKGVKVTTRVEAVTQVESTAYCGLFAVRSDLVFTVPR